MALLILQPALVLALDIGLIDSDQQAIANGITTVFLDPRVRLLLSGSADRAVPAGRDRRGAARTRVVAGFGRACARAGLHDRGRIERGDACRSRDG